MATQEQLRRRQIFAVAAGVASALVSLLGGVMENAWLARAGAAGFLAALMVVIALGWIAWRRFG